MGEMAFTPRTARWALAVWLTSLFMTQLDVTIVNVATPSIHAHLGASGAELELVVGGYLLAYAVLLITGARLGEMLGYRRVFLTGLATFSGASLACGVAPDPIVLIAALVAQGAGAALMVPQVLSAIQLELDGARRAQALGLYAVALSAGAVSGQILGGVLVFAIGWRPIFLLNVPIGVAALAVGVRVLPADRERDSARSVDIAGVATLCGALLPAILALSIGRQEGWPAWTWACLAASPLALAAFVAAERRAAARGGSALIDLRVVARPAVSWGLLAQATAVSTYYALLFTLAVYLQQGLGRSALVSGLTLVSWVAAFGVAGQLLRRWGARIGRLAPPAGCVVLSVAYVAITAVLLAEPRAEAPLIVALGVGGLGLGIEFSSMLTHLTGAVAPRHAPDISGVFTTVIQVAGAVAVAAFGSAYLSLASAGDAAHALAVVTAGFALIALLAAAMARRAVEAR
jgi:predicted MFS family arabinose efflux permease